MRDPAPVFFVISRCTLDVPLRMPSAACANDANLHRNQKYCSLKAFAGTAPVQAQHLFMKVGGADVQAQHLFMKVGGAEGGWGIIRGFFLGFLIVPMFRCAHIYVLSTRVPGYPVPGTVPGYSIREQFRFLPALP